MSVYKTKQRSQPVTGYSPIPMVQLELGQASPKLFIARLHLLRQVIERSN